jgi:rhodanese-related sulfurtransferase
MRAAFVLAAVLALTAWPSVAGAQDEDNPASVPRMSLREFRKALEAGRIIAIDTRDAESYVEGHIPGALLVPVADVQTHARELKAAGKPIVAYCA